MDRQFLIPANSKRSLLIFGAFREIDLIIFGIGVFFSFVGVLALPMEKILFTVIALAPGAITGLLVMPIPNYHNVLHIIKTIFKFYFIDNQNYYWKGWDYKDGFEE